MSDRIFKYEPLWGDWTVETLLGEGTFGKVYRLSKMQNGEKVYSVAKIIHLPLSRNDTKKLSEAGLPPEKISEMYSAAINKLSKEIDRFTSKRPMANIVNYLDSMIQLDESNEWDIILHMEELTPLSEWLDGNKLTVRDVIRLGQEISNTLTQLARVNVVHTDIKPENIFITSFGSFKLADVGVASSLSQVCPSLESRRVHLYTAPEIVEGMENDSSSDLYSLGILLYRLLNRNRLPLMPAYPIEVSEKDVLDAMQRRLAGEDIAGLPPEVSKGVAGAIYSMTRFSPKDRIKDAATIKQEFDDLYLFEAGLDEICETSSGSNLYNTFHHFENEEAEEIAIEDAAQEEIFEGESYEEEEPEAIEKSSLPEGGLSENISIEVVDEYPVGDVNDASNDDFGQLWTPGGLSDGIPEQDGNSDAFFSDFDALSDEPGIFSLDSPEFGDEEEIVEVGESLESPEFLDGSWVISSDAEEAVQEVDEEQIELDVEDYEEPEADPEQAEAIDDSQSQDSLNDDIFFASDDLELINNPYAFDVDEPDKAEGQISFIEDEEIEPAIEPQMPQNSESEPYYGYQSDEGLEPQGQKSDEASFDGGAFNDGMSSEAPPYSENLTFDSISDDDQELEDELIIPDVADEEKSASEWSDVANLFSSEWQDLTKEEPSAIETDLPEIDEGEPIAQAEEPSDEDAPGNVALSESPYFDDSASSWLGMSTLDDDLKPSSEEFPGLPVLSEEFLQMDDGYVSPLSIGSSALLDEDESEYYNSVNQNASFSGLEMEEVEAKSEVQETIKAIGLETEEKADWGEIVDTIDDGVIESVLGAGEEEEPPAQEVYFSLQDDSEITDISTEDEETIQGQEVFEPLENELDESAYDGGLIIREEIPDDDIDEDEVLFDESSLETEDIASYFNDSLIQDSESKPDLPIIAQTDQIEGHNALEDSLTSEKNSEFSSIALDEVIFGIALDESITPAEESMIFERTEAGPVDSEEAVFEVDSVIESSIAIDSHIPEELSDFEPNEDKPEERYDTIGVITPSVATASPLPEKSLIERLNSDVEISGEAIERIRAGERINPVDIASSEPGIEPSGENSEVLFQNENFGIIRHSPPRPPSEPAIIATADELTGDIKKVDEATGPPKAKPKPPDPEEDEGDSRESLDGLVKIIDDELENSTEEDDEYEQNSNPYKDHIIPEAFKGIGDEPELYDDQDSIPERRIRRNFQKSVNESSAMVEPRHQDAATIASDALRDSDPVYAQSSDNKQLNETKNDLGNISGDKIETANESLENSANPFQASIENPQPGSNNNNILSDKKEDGMPPGFSHNLVHGLRDNSEDTKEGIGISGNGEGEGKGEEEAFQTLNLFSEHTLRGPKIPEADPTVLISGNIIESSDELSIFKENPPKDKSGVTFTPTASEREELRKARPQDYDSKEYYAKGASASALGVKATAEKPQPAKETLAQPKQADRSSTAPPARFHALEYGNKTQQRPQPYSERLNGVGSGATASLYEESSSSGRQAKAKGGFLNTGWAKLALVIMVVLMGVSGFYLFNLNKRYNEGMKLMGKESYTEAIAVFESLKGFKDSTKKVTQCNSELQKQYDSAKDKMQSKDYKAAMEILTKIGSYKDAKTLRETCSSETSYEAAQALQKSGQYYEAYKKFTQLGEFKDSSAKAKSCIQNTPKTGYSFVNKSFSEDEATMILRNPAGAQNDLFIKLYSKDNKLALTAFIRVGGSLNCKIRGGDYKLNVAFGKDWFGETDAFGDAGEYDTLKIEQGKNTISMRTGYISTYTIKSRREGFDLLEYIDRSDF